MRHKRLQLSTIILLGLGLIGLQAQTMYLRPSIGTQTAYNLSNVRKMTFSGGNINVQKTNNSTDVFALSGLRYLNFTNLTSGIGNHPLQGMNAQLRTYPNPVDNLLNIDLSGEEGTGTVSIFTLQGKMIQTQHVSCNGLVTLNLSHLQKGIYLCSYSNDVKIKIVKIIKQ